jgi:hypothetical protein
MKLITCLECGESKQSQYSGICQACYKRRRRGERVGPVRRLCPGDWLETPDGATRIGFVWDIDGDRVEVRSYEVRDVTKPTIRKMTRAQACWYRIIPNPAHGDQRPLLGVKA